MKNLKGSGQPTYRATSAVDRGQLKSTGGAKLFIHICVGDPTIETIFRTVVSANQLSMYGAAADL